MSSGRRCLQYAKNKLKIRTHSFRKPTLIEPFLDALDKVEKNLEKQYKNHKIPQIRNHQAFRS